MKVIFLQDVPNVAKAGDIKEVAAGFGRNFLFPRKLAALASPGAMGQVRTGGQAQARTDQELVELARQLEGKEVSLKAHAGAKERLYGSITSADIAAGLERVTGIAVDKRRIELDEPIRQLGSYELTIRLGKDITPKIIVSVIEEETTKAEPPKKEKKAGKKAPKAEKKPAKKEAKTTEKKEAKAPKEKKAAKKEKTTPKKTKKTATKAKTTKKKKEEKA